MQVINLVEEEEKAARWMELTAPAEPKDFIKENKEGCSGGSMVHPSFLFFSTCITDAAAVVCGLRAVDR